MAYYDALKAKWATLTGTVADKLTAINAATVVGPRVDVAISSVVGYLALQAKLSTLQAYASNPPTSAVPQAVVAAKELVTLIATPSIHIFQLTDANTYAAVSNFLNALAGDAGTGIVASDVTALLGMAETTVSWWSANGYSSPISQTDLDAAGGLV